ncbi:hypothetical protein R69746_03380 [Paraburkholderia aspalathi]|nr:hypothetical protein R69746_03380 [Paraburkholderia aspalathi]
MNHETMPVAAGTVPQAFGLRQVREIELTRVLRHQHQWQLSYAAKCLVDMPAKYALNINLWIVEEPVCRLQIRSTESLRKRTVRCLRQLPCQQGQALRQSGIPERGGAKLVIRPVIAFSYACQFYSPPENRSGATLTPPGAVYNPCGMALPTLPEMWVNLRPPAAGSPPFPAGAAGAGRR